MQELPTRSQYYVLARRRQLHLSLGGGHDRVRPLIDYGSDLEYLERQSHARRIASGGLRMRASTTAPRRRRRAPAPTESSHAEQPNGAHRCSQGRFGAAQAEQRWRKEARRGSVKPRRDRC